MGTNNHKAEADPGARQIMNANIGLDNVISFDISNKQICGALKACYQLLADHCGPRSGYAMILEDKGIDLTFQPSHFTRDGIRILTALDMMSPLERYFKNILTYVGARVDSAAHDGTTTSMMVSAIFLDYMLSNQDFILDLRMPTVEISAVADKVLDDIIAELDKVAVGPEYVSELMNVDALHAGGLIAYAQAMSSSGGNADLALAMKEIFDRSPESTWDTIEYLTSKKETGNPYTVEVDESDAKIRCISASRRALNANFGTECILKDSLVIVSPQAMMQGDFSSGEIMDYIHSLPEDQSVTLIAPMVDGTFTVQLDALDKKRKAPLNIWQFSPEEQIAGQNYPWELFVILAKAGKSPWMDDYEGAPEDHVFKADIHWKDTYMHLSNFVEGATEDSVLHPMYLDPDKASKFYADSLKEIQDTLQEYDEGHRPDGVMKTHFVRVLNSLTCLRRPKLRLGGPVHIQLANRDVVEDVQGAIMSSLKYGFLINGLSNVLNIVRKLYSSITHSVDPADVLRGHILVGLHNALFMTLCAAYGYDPARRPVDEVVPAPDAYTSCETGLAISYNFGDYLRQVEQNPDAVATFYPPIQPVMIYKELFKRMKELLVKVICTNKAIVFGGIMLKENEDGDSKSQ